MDHARRATTMIPSQFKFHFHLSGLRHDPWPLYERRGHKKRALSEHRCEQCETRGGTAMNRNTWSLLELLRLEKGHIRWAHRVEQAAGYS